MFKLQGWVNKVITGAKSFVTVIENVVAWAATLVITVTHFSDQFRSRVLSHLIKSISRVFQKFLRWFNGTIIWAFFVLLSPVWPINFSFVLNESVSPFSSLKSLISPLLAKVSTSLQCCHQISDVFE